jgi:hypothetical protein
MTLRQRAVHMTINANAHSGHSYNVFDLDKWCSRYIFKNKQGKLTLKSQDRV